MKIKRGTGFIALALMLILAGCGSTPSSNYYVLAARDLPQSSSQQPSLGIGPVEIPEYLNRNGLVYSRDGNQLQIAQYERWAEPLEEGIVRVLGLNLAGLLGTENIRTFPWHPARAPQYGIKLRLMALDADDSNAELVAEWLVYKPDRDSRSDTTVSRRISRLLIPVNNNQLQPGDLPGIYSKLLFQLSEEIAAAIRADTDSRQKSQ
jgi:uncharacterized lipoprotein YmbA